MKKLFSIIAVPALTFGMSVGALAASKPAAPAKPADATQPADAAKAPAAKATGEVKPIPMHSRADAIDTKAQTFTTKRKDGVEVKHVITAATEIKQGETAAKLEDIKIGDYVSGLRKKVSETEYTVVKITKFGPYSEKKEGDAKPAPAKPADAKPAPKKAS